jgi:exodeoxyribonuclease VII large subunit
MPEQPRLFAEPPKVFTVSALTAEIRTLLTREFDDIRVSGEISSYKVWPSGHAYFTLKDQNSQLRCVLFRNALRLMRFKPQDGLAVIARGSVDVREERGEYQFIVSSLEPQGLGELQLAFEQLKKRLEAEGLFAAARKRPLPKFPTRIGMVTSPKGAVIRDMLNILGRRFPGLQVRLYPTLVQGESAAAGVCEGIEHFSKSGWAEVVIVGRGGGSLEDLWAFNEESVARAIAACSVPVVSAVGHETDFTIADFVADLRAPTPSAAAELVVPNLEDILEHIRATAARSERAMHYRLAITSRRLTERGITKATGLLQRRIGRLLQRVDDLEYRSRTRMTAAIATDRRLFEDLQRRLRSQDLRVRVMRGRQRLALAEHSAGQAMLGRLHGARRRLDPLAARLETLSPLRVLERGYSIVQMPDGRVVTRYEDAPVEAKIRVRLAKGQLGARVEESRE